MNIGAMRDQVNILKPLVVPDGRPGRPVTWIDLVTESATALTRLWAKVAPATGRESIAATAMSASITYTVVMRYRADIDETMRVSWRPYKATVDKSLEIHAVLLDSGRAFVTLLCSET